MGLELVAEGVETQNQATKLLELGCSILQGYLYCRPIPFAQLCLYLDADQSIGSRGSMSRKRSRKQALRGAGIR